MICYLYPWFSCFSFHFFLYITDLLLSKDCSVCFVFSINSVWLASDLLQNVFRCDCALYFPVSIKVRKESNVLYFKVCFPLLIVKIMSCSAISEYVHFVQMLTTKNACAQNTILTVSPASSKYWTFLFILSKMDFQLCSVALSNSNRLYVWILNCVYHFELSLTVGIDITA